MLPNNRFDDEGRLKEHAQMSKNPYLGYYYVEKNKENHLNNKNLFTYRNGFKIRLPRTIKTKIFEDHEEVYSEAVTRATRIAEEKYLQELEKLEKDGYTDPEYELYKRQLHKANKARKRAEASGKL